jgi:antibiotic biosynthesis monooxygenase (ABM) superfamily enzyme
MSKRQPAAHTDSPAAQMRSVAPPSKHQLAIMIWIAVFPTLTVLNLTLGPHLAHVSPVLAHLRVATIAVPIVIYGVMPQLHRVRVRILTRATA